MSSAPPRPFTIYLCTNIVTGKRYVGQTTMGLKRRWGVHQTAAKQGKGTLIAVAIREHGPRAFATEELQVVEGVEAANEAEIAWIARLGTRAPDGYNLDAGGNSNAHEITREKLSRIRREYHAAKTPEERSAAARARMATIPPEQRRASALKIRDGMTPEQRSERTRKGHLSRTPEQRAEQGRKVRAWFADRTPEERERSSAKRSASAKARCDRMTPEQRRERGRLLAAGRWAPRREGLE